MSIVKLNLEKDRSDLMSPAELNARVIKQARSN